MAGSRTRRDGTDGQLSFDLLLRGSGAGAPAGPPAAEDGLGGGWGEPVARLAQQHWTRWRPEELSRTPGPGDVLFRLGPPPPDPGPGAGRGVGRDGPRGEVYLARLGRLRMARVDAEAQILRPGEFRETRRACGWRRRSTRRRRFWWAMCNAQSAW